MRATRPAAAAIAAALALAACTEPVPPDKQDPPEPQAHAPQATGLRDAIQAPIDQARAVDAQMQDAAQQQRDAIEAQAGG